jgi:peptide-methionine (S)-S-oxide reductase
MAAVFYHNDEQKDLAMETRDRLLPQVTGKIFSRKGKIQTKILPTSEFYLAEDYHQKYLLRKTPLLIKEFAAIYPSTSDLVNSTAAARVNGYVGGYGTEAMLQAEIDGLGLSPAGRQKLLEIVRRFNR